MSSAIDVPLDSLVHNSRGGMGRGRGRGRGRGGFTRGGGASVRGRGMPMRGGKRGGGAGAAGIKARLGYNTEEKFTQQNGEKSVSDLRDVLAIKTKTDVKDLRAKLPPKVSTTSKGGKAASGSAGKGAASSRGQTTTKRDKAAPATSRSSSSSIIKAALNSRTASNTTRGSGSGRGILHGDRPTSLSSSRKPIKESTRRLPTTAEAKKITVTVQGIGKTTNEVRGQ